jgi:hypothetical protein
MTPFEQMMDGLNTLEQAKLYEHTTGELPYPVRHAAEMVERGRLQVSAYHDRLRKVYGAKADSIIAKIGKDTKSGTSFAVNQTVYANVGGQLQSMVYDGDLALQARQAEQELDDAVARLDHPLYIRKVIPNPEDPARTSIAPEVITISRPIPYRTRLPEVQRPKPMFTEGRRFRTEN